MIRLLNIFLLLIITLSAFVLMASYITGRVVPKYFAGQWQPTPGTLNTTGEYDNTEEEGVFLGRKVKSTDVSPDRDNTLASTAVLGDSDTLNKRIEVDLTNQKVYAFENDIKIMEFVISSGKWGKTPTGHFTIAYKTLAQKMSGGSKALGTYYYLPNVQFVQFFGNKEIPWSRGFAFHGTYWHNNFGTPMSHGCINMRNEDAEKLFYWTTPAMGEKRTVKATVENPGTPVYIYGVAPKG